MSTSGRMDKLWHIHTLEHYSTVKRNKLLMHTTKESHSDYAERNKAASESYILYDSISVTSPGAKS